MNPIRCRARAAIFALLVLVGLSACEATAQVDIDVKENGSGTVTVEVALDGEAVGRVGGLKAIDTGDLTEAGWEVAEPMLKPDGLVRLRATKAFGSPSALQPTLNEIAGPDGPLQELNLSVLDRFGSIGYRLDGRLITKGDLARFSDAQVAEVLDGLPLGRTDEQLAAELKTNPGSLTIVVRAMLPGELVDTTGKQEKTPTVDGATVSWNADLTAESADVDLTTTSEERSGNAGKFVIAGAVLIGLAGLVLAYGLIAGRRLNHG